MKTNQFMVKVRSMMQQYGILFFLLIASFAGMGGCNDKEEPVEIPADEMTTDVQQAPEIPVWAPANTSPSVRFYFIPEMSIYYDAFMGHYVYWNGFYWVYSPMLPHGYVYLDLFDANIVFLSVGITYPWHHHHLYVSRYPVYFFAGDYHRHKHGWRFYDENGRGFYGVHRNVKYNTHYNIHQRKNDWGKPGKDNHQKFDKQPFGNPKSDKQHYNKPGGGKQEQNYWKQDNKGGGKKNEPVIKKDQPGGKQTIQKSGTRKTPEIKMQNRTKISPGSKGGGGGKKGGGK